MIFSTLFNVTQIGVVPLSSHFPTPSKKCGKLHLFLIIFFNFSVDFAVTPPSKPSIMSSLCVRRYSEVLRGPTEKEELLFEFSISNLSWNFVFN